MKQDASEEKASKDQNGVRHFGSERESFQMTTLPKVFLNFPKLPKMKKIPIEDGFKYFQYPE